MAIRRRPNPARTLALAAAVALAGALLSVTAPVAASTGHPAGNTTASGLNACASDRDDDSAACLAGAIADYDRARAAEGMGPMTLPAGYAALTAPQQLLTLTNIDRVDRGLPPIAGLSATLNASARGGAASASDPAPPKNLTAHGVTSMRMGSNWASALNPLWAEFLWMYDDGPGSGNADCHRSSDAGCWGHRDNILAPYSGKALMGAATGSTGSAAIYVDRTPQYTDVTYSWKGGKAGAAPSAKRHHLVVAGRPGRITGRPIVGRTLTAHLPGLHVDSATGPAPKGVKARIAWLRDGRIIARSTGARHRVTGADRGHRITFRVVFRGARYASARTFTSGSVRVLR